MKILALMNEMPHTARLIQLDIQHFLGIGSCIPADVLGEFSCEKLPPTVDFSLILELIDSLISEQGCDNQGSNWHKFAFTLKLAEDRQTWQMG